jgi:Uma2 family endonuclease
LPSAERRQRFAQAAIADYWAVDMAQVALSTYDSPQSNGYKQCKLLHVGERASPTALPQIALRLQEPLPLYFLTRTIRGQRTYTRWALPLQVC